MISRRSFLGSAGLVAMSTATGVPALASGPPRWPRYPQAMAIDALSGIDFLLIDEKDPAAATALQHVRDCGLAAVVMTAAPQGRCWLDDAAYHATCKRIDEWKARIARHPDLMLLVRSGADLERAHRQKRVGVILTFQGTEPLGEDIDRNTGFHAQGVRVIQLTHNRRNLVGDGCMEPGNAGLSNYGRDVVERLNARRIVVDLSHGAPRTI